ncbi:hypothetical protein Q664_11785 [Archangium violaceum Cb vi76]|uniref:HEAT repeat domain-containing protein n=2 Tax=Archangium violaceum TaxID=83451 RepID=A0A084SWY0_9BACT|nr:hypothetical protein Q664_11785 [Archangium violaceum Cb vi76]
MEPQTGPTAMTPTSPPPPSSSPPGTSSRRKPLLAAGAGLVAVLAGVALIGRGGEAKEGPVETGPAAAQASAKQGPARKTNTPSPTGAPSLPGEEAKAPRFQETLCWKELERFNEGVTIHNFRQWAEPLLNSRDGLVRDFLRERLTELIGKDPANALQVLSWSLDAPGKPFGVYLTAVRDSEAVHQPQVATKLLDMGLDNALPTERRAGILSALDTQKRLAPAALDKLTTFANDPVSGEAGWAAARTIARVMKREFKQNENIGPYMDKLLTIGAQSPDEQIRYLGQMMPMHAAPLLSAEETERFARILVGEGSEEGRDAAAHNLSLSLDKGKVLDLFAKTFETEQSLCVKWALFRFSARTAGKRALPVMANMATMDPRFQPIYQDFERLYASGILDFVRLYNSLPNQDPFSCLDRHE